MSTKQDKKTALSPKQKQMAEMLANPENEHNTISAICEELGISRNTYYSIWLKDEKFMAYVNELVERYTDSELASVWRVLIDKCLEGNVNAIKLFFELKGKYKQKVELDGGVVFITGEDKLEK
ncbi:MAG: phBC6A51 family helix-turn-helix protein [Acutalibacteraceae bacterium]